MSAVGQRGLEDWLGLDRDAISGLVIFTKNGKAVASKFNKEQNVEDL